VYPGGHYGNVVAMLPPLIASNEQLAATVRVLGEAIHELL
jgi:4-aminobutyrate aminotransferase-like enzyme